MCSFAFLGDIAKLTFDKIDKKLQQGPRFLSLHLGLYESVY